VNFVVSLVLLLAALVPLSLAESGATAGVAQSVVARSSQVAGENESYDASYEASQWWSPGDAHTLGAAEFDNPFGKVGVVYDGTLNTRGHPFFEPLSENGRACVTCHQPADGMGLSLRSIKERWETTGGKDPLFAAVDGSNCPNLPQGDPKSHSLLLERGLFLVALPWPPRNLDGTLIEPEFTIEVVADPTGCNTHPVYGLNSPTPKISVYRRPRMAANLSFVTAPPFQQFNIKDGMPMRKDPDAGQRSSMQLMADSRHLNLQRQAMEAGANHLERKQQFSMHELEQIVDFEMRIYAAQSRDRLAGDFAAPGMPEALGPQAMLRHAPKSGASTENGFSYQQRLFFDFSDWAKRVGYGPDAKAEDEFRASVARGYDVFFLKSFLLTDAVGVNDVGLGNPYRTTCGFCHNTVLTGQDRVPSFMDIGTANLPAAEKMPDLPVFKLECKASALPHPYLGRTIFTHDPGRALVTGRCSEIGSLTMQQMRGMAAREPFFSNGSAATIRALIDFYDRRFSIGYTEQEKRDLENFLRVL
jgi:hypothetical protein